MPQTIRSFLRKGGAWFRQEDAGVVDSLVTDMIMWIFATTITGYIAGILSAAITTDVQSLSSVILNLF